MIKFARGVMLAIVLSVLGWVSPVQADLLEELIPGAKLYGQARFKVLLFPIYDASLYTVGGVYDKQAPLAMRLDYLTSLDKERIVKQTVKAMQRRSLGSEAEIAKWTKIMEKYFDDVQENDQILIVFPDLEKVVFSTNDGPPEIVKDAKFSIAFRDLWLGENIRNKRFQSDLLGLK
jgi:hypothetical protein